MSYGSYRTSSAQSRGRGFSGRGSFRGRGGGDASGSSWSTSPRGGRGGFSGPSRGRFNWYKEHSSSNFDSRSRYGSGAASGGSERYSSRGRPDDSYRRSYRDVPEYSSRDHSHHRSPESQRKRMRTEHYVQASSGRRSHEGSYIGGGSDYNNRYSYEDKGYGEDRGRGYRDERRSAGGFRDRSREEYPHRKVAEPLDSGMPPPSGGPPRHVSSPRGSYRGRLSTRGIRGLSRLTLARRADAILARKRSMMDSYAIRKRILTSKIHADSLRRLKIQKLRRMRELAAKKEGKSEKDGSGKGPEEVSGEEDGKDDNWDEDEDDDEEEEEEEEEEDDEKVDGELEEGETTEKVEKKTKKVKKEKKAANKEEEREEGEEVDEEDEAADENGEGKKTTKKSDSKNNGSVHITIKQDSDGRAVSEDVKRTTFHGKPFIRLTCPHCFVRCITFKEYSIHLYSSKHIGAMRKQALRLKQTLARMRMTQRQKQRIVEENEAVHGSLSSRTKFCPICKLNYRQLKTKHQTSDYHRAMKKFLMPYCRVCRLGFKSPMLFENHICSLDHIKREERLKENMRFRDRSRDDGSGIEDEDKEVNLDNFMTLDSVGTVDDEGDDDNSDGEGKGKSEKERKEGDEKKRTETNLGSEYIKKVEVYFCELCRIYLPRLEQLDRTLSVHCRSRLHLQRYVRYRDDRNLRREADRLHHREKAREAAEKEEKADVKKEQAPEKKTENTAEKEQEKIAEDANESKTKSEIEEADGSLEASVDAGEGTRTDGETADGDGAEDMDQELEASMDDKLWAAVDKDLGDLLREVEPGNKSSDEDDDSRAGGGRYDRFRYSEKGAGSQSEGEATETTKAAVDGVDGEQESETAEGTKDPAIEEPEADCTSTPKKGSPSGAVSTPPATTTTTPTTTAAASTTAVAAATTTTTTTAAAATPTN